MTTKKDVRGRGVESELCTLLHVRFAGWGSIQIIRIFFNIVPVIEDVLGLEN